MRHAKANAQASSAAEVQRPDGLRRRELACGQDDVPGRGHTERSLAGIYVSNEEHGIYHRRPSGNRPGDRHRVVVVGGGFAGLQAVRGLRKADAEVTLVDRRNFHLFQPLLYQLATGALSPGEIAYPLRGILARQGTARVVLAEVAAIDLPGRRVRLRGQAGGASDRQSKNVNHYVTYR